MFHLIYASSATRLLNAEELREIHVDAVRGNAARGVTGFLLYRGGNFMQVLEGEEPVVRKLFESIRRDARHKDMYVLRESEVPERMFARFAMGCANRGTLGDLPKYRDVLKASLDSLRFRKDGRLALRMLESFAELSA